MITGPDQAAQMRWAGNRIDDLENDVRQARAIATTLAAKLAAYESVTVPRADFDRVREQRDAEIVTHTATGERLADALRLCDELTKALQNANDGRARVALGQALDLLQEAARLTARDAGGPEEQEYRQRRMAFLAESGRNPWGGVL